MSKGDLQVDFPQCLNSLNDFRRGRGLALSPGDSGSEPTPWCASDGGDEAGTSIHDGRIGWADTAVD